MWSKLLEIGKCLESSEEVYKGVEEKAFVTTYLRKGLQRIKPRANKHIKKCHNANFNLIALKFAPQHLQWQKTIFCQYLMKINISFTIFWTISKNICWEIPSVHEINALILQKKTFLTKAKMYLSSSAAAYIIGTKSDYEEDNNAERFCYECKTFTEKLCVR